MTLSIVPPFPIPKISTCKPTQSTCHSPPNLFQMPSGERNAFPRANLGTSGSGLGIVRCKSRVCQVNVRCPLNHTHLPDPNYTAPLDLTCHLPWPCYIASIGFTSQLTPPPPLLYNSPPPPQCWPSSSHCFSSSQLHPSQSAFPPQQTSQTLTSSPQLLMPPSPPSPKRTDMTIS